MNVVKVLKKEGLELPIHETELSAGVDVQALSLMKLFTGNKEVDTQKLTTANEYFYLRGFERALIGTGLFVELPDLTQFEVRPRSGVVLKRGLFVANSPGTIDADYRYEIGVIVFNSTPFLNKIQIGEKIAQLVLMPYLKFKWEEVEELSDVKNRTGGFGSTNK